MGVTHNAQTPFSTKRHHAVKPPYELKGRAPWVEEDVFVKTEKV